MKGAIIIKWANNDEGLNHKWALFGLFHFFIEGFFERLFCQHVLKSIYNFPNKLHSLLQNHVFYALSIVIEMTGMIKVVVQKWISWFSFVHFARMTKMGMFEMIMMIKILSQNGHCQLHVAFECMRGTKSS